ncbi:MAG: hypothetical protein QNJ04_00790 [Desulfobacterales bacterium]|nr:hypothetical protein [Desulfobacterales bacterium]
MMERAYRDTHEMLPPAETKNENNQATEGAPDPTTAQPRPKQPRYGRSYLINKLNYINFQNGTIQLVLTHRRFDQTTICIARPLPCEGRRLVCRWSDPHPSAALLENYRFSALFVNDGRHALEVVPRVVRMDEKEIELELPDECREVANRRDTRYACDRIPVQVIQNSMLFRGVLLEFSTRAFRIALTVAPPQTFQCLDHAKPLNLIVFDGDELVFTGDFTILKSGDGRHEREFVLKPEIKAIQRYNAKVYRSKRIELKPAPNIVFRHPLTSQTVNLKVLDLSGSGLSVSEGAGHSLLLPGMMLNEVELLFADSLTLNFKAQVLYRNPKHSEDRTGDIVNGLAIIDMASGDHLKLLSLLQQAENQNAYINTRIELDALWDFFFETGFIYPKKYAFIQANKETIKETYWRLYTQNPTVARHFIYQTEGRIMAHMGMVRLYENAWLIHHHAARKRSLVHAGLTVLNQIGHFIYDSHRLYSMHMKYLMCYFQPENNFPNSVFGGFARYINDRACCSLDNFAYFHLPALEEADSSSLPDEWTLDHCTAADMEEIGNWYRHQIGGPMLDCLDLDTQMFASTDLAEEYRRHGFAKDRLLLSLRRNNRIQACIIIHRTDIGLNLSDLTNCVKILLIDRRSMSRKILLKSLRLLYQRHALNPDMPVLLNPSDFAEQTAIPVEKNYSLWILNTRHSDKYFGFLSKMFKLARE